MMKTCSRCQLEKEIFEFNKNTHHCRKCQKQYRKAYYANNKEKEQLANNEWKSNNPTYMQKYLKKYKKQYVEANRGKVTAIENKRRAKKMNATPSWLTKRDLLHIQCLYQVAAMRSIESGFKWHVDHVVPLQGKTVCGLHVPWNLKIIPARDNLAKNNKHLEN